MWHWLHSLQWRYFYSLAGKTHKSCVARFVCQAQQAMLSDEEGVNSTYSPPSSKACWSRNTRYLEQCYFLFPDPGYNLESSHNTSRHSYITVS